VVDEPVVAEPVVEEPPQVVEVPEAVVDEPQEPARDSEAATADVADPLPQWQIPGIMPDRTFPSGFLGRSRGRRR
jgi:hypothetical protein